jgi:hypothetical protein
MKVNGFFSSLVFAAIAAILLVFMQHVFSPVIGYWNVLVIHLAGSVVVYAATIGKTLHQALRNGCVAGLGAGAVVMMATSTGEVALGLTVVLGLVRTGLDSAFRNPRRIFVEGGLAVAALGFASWLSSPSWLGAAAALWGYSLVQSLYFLVPMSDRKGQGVEERDAFDQARERLLVLLEEA